MSELLFAKATVFFYHPNIAVNVYKFKRFHENDTVTDNLFVLSS